MPVLAIELPFCCVHHSTDSQCFLMGRTTSKNSHFRGGCRSPCNTWFLGPIRVYLEPVGVSIGSAARDRDQQTDTQTTLVTLLRQCRIIHVARVANATGLGPQRGLRKSKKIAMALNIQRCCPRSHVCKKLDYELGKTSLNHMSLVTA